MTFVDTTDLVILLHSLDGIYSLMVLLHCCLSVLFTQMVLTCGMLFSVFTLTLSRPWGMGEVGWGKMEFASANFEHIVLYQLLLE